MRFGIISDIHSNYYALSSTIEELNKEAPDRIICLGDIVGYGPQPTECVEEIKNFIGGGEVVVGNHDLAIIGKKPLDWFNNSAKSAIIWTIKNIKEEAARYFDNLPEKVSISTEDKIKNIFIVHGSLRSPTDEYLFPDAIKEVYANFLKLIDYLPGAILLVGHTHIPFAFEFDLNLKCITPIDLTKEEKNITLDQNYYYILNPGAVGQPRDGNPAASFAILDTNKANFYIRRVNYNIEATQKKMREAHLPEELIYRLELGR